MSEETDALSNRIRQLENQVADMQRLAQDTSDLLDIARANGLDKFLTGHGLVEYGGGIMRLDENGIQINTNGNPTAAIHYVDKFYTAIPTTTSSYQDGWISSGTAQGQVVTATTTSGAILQSYSQPDDGRITLHSYASDNIYLIVEATTTTQYVEVQNAPLWIAGGAADPSYTVNEGSFFTRTDTHKPRYYNGTLWDNLATESYVAANGASYAKLMFWGGA